MQDLDPARFPHQLVKFHQVLARRPASVVADAPQQEAAGTVGMIAHPVLDLAAGGAGG